MKGNADRIIYSSQRKKQTNGSFRECGDFIEDDPGEMKVMSRIRRHARQTRKELIDIKWQYIKYAPYTFLVLYISCCIL